MRDASSIVGFATVEQELYVDRRQLAKLMGVSVSTIDRMVAQGMPSVTWGRRARRFKPSAAMTWAHAQARKEAA